MTTSCNGSKRTLLLKENVPLKNCTTYESILFQFHDLPSHFRRRSTWREGWSRETWSTSWCRRQETFWPSRDRFNQLANFIFCGLFRHLNTRGTVVRPWNRQPHQNYRATHPNCKILLLTWLWQFRHLVGRYCRSLLPRQDGETSQIQVNRRFLQFGCVAL